MSKISRKSLLTKVRAGWHFLVGTICLLLTIYGLGCFLFVGRGSGGFLSWLPDYDYKSEILALEKDDHLMEAEQLADFVLSGSEIQNKDEIAVIRERVHKRRTSLLGRTQRVLKGFVRGDGKSAEEIAGGIASDLVLWGDIRDFCQQGYYKVTGKETDHVILALASLGLVTELADCVDWGPAVLKAFRKVGSLSQKFCDSLVTLCKKSMKLKKADKTLTDMFTHLKVLCDDVGTTRAAVMMKHVDDVSDLKTLAKTAKNAPDAVTVIIRSSGHSGIGLVEKLSAADDTGKLLEAVARKGPGTVEMLVKSGAREVRLLSRVSKIVYRGRLPDLLCRLSRGHACLAIAVFVLFFGMKSAFSFYRGIRLIKTAWVRSDACSIL